jgi:gas vesicle protein
MSKRSASTIKKFAIGTAMAGAAGYVVGILSAPRAGKKTREDIKKSTDHSVNEVEKQLKELHTELGQLVDDAKDGNLSMAAKKKFGAALDGAKTTKDKLREVLSAIHEGEADDQELDKALKDAKRALNHLKSFISK